MKKNLFNILLSIVGAGLLMFDPLSAASPQSAAAWTVSSRLYADKNSEMPQIEYTRDFRHITLPEFWIDRIENPDRLILNPSQIEKFNAQTAHLKESIFPPEDFNATYSGEWVGDKLARQFAFLAIRSFYDEKGKPIDENLMSELWGKCNYDKIPPTVTTRYALVVRYAHHRLTPSKLTLLKKPQQRYFDRNQNAALDIGTPLAVFHSSSDGKWYFALSPSSYGWIAAEDIAFASREEMMGYARSRHFVVTTNPKNALFVDGHYDDFVRMGVRLPYVGKRGEEMLVQIPRRDKKGRLKPVTAALKSSDVHLGYLPYTPRTIITQAFKFLNAPYGWGGMFGEQDCSKFIQQLYAVTGILLPRNSGDQEKAGRPLITFDGSTQEHVRELIRVGEPGTTLLHLPGHIMLYLGSYRGDPYIIHAVWGAVEGRNPLAKTAVTTVHFKHYIDKMDTAVAVKP
jgi:cell wall-associated NlpC family hydrolase